MRRQTLLLPAACLLLLVIGLYYHRDQVAQFSRPELFKPPAQGEENGVPPETAPDPVTVKPTALPEEKVALYVNAIMTPTVTDLPRLECPELDSARYQELRQTGSDVGIQYYFAINLRQCVGLLPRLIGSVVQTMRFLGPEKCALSIVEGNSKDGTNEVLAALRSELEALGVTYYFDTSNINPKKGNRIKALAQLRNLALQPLLDTYTDTDTNLLPPPPTVIFLNDVAICPEDILELVLQRRTQQADMVCAMDWTHVGPEPSFYDVWIARGMTGDSFFEIPPDGSWSRAWNLFWNDPASRAALDAHRPFQVFACWNGAVAFTAEPLVRKSLRFRWPREGECFQGEPQLFCKDLWYYGYGKIAVVPAVNLEYTNDKGRKIKQEKGYTSEWVSAPDWKDEAIEWQADPPEKVKCFAGWKKQFFRVWNETEPGT
ncbi:glycosyltransferase family 69 protein [Corynascus similis CBS 632.67]